MNIRQLSKQIGTSLRLRPLPRRFLADGHELDPIDDSWTLEAILDAPTRVRLSNPATGHFVEIQPDNIRGYQSPDFLTLRCQLLIRGKEIDFEPSLSHNPTFARIEILMPALLVEMRRDLAEHPLAREVVLLERADVYWAGGEELAYYFDDHADLSSKFQILTNLGLTTDITHNSVRRYRVAEPFAQYLGA